MAMISYAGNMEDVLLARALGSEPGGCYIDIGSGSPLLDSVTRHFHEAGWRGINIEPQSQFHEECLQQRPEDVTLQAVVGKATGQVTLYENLNNLGLSTVSAELAEAYRASGMEVVEREVEMVTLAQVCETYVTGPIDFCTIDVEGHERDVLLGGDWDRWRPRIVVIEATIPMTTCQVDRHWADVLLGARYIDAYFDGLNRYFVTEEAAQLIPTLAVQPNWFDQAVPYREVVLRRRIGVLEEQVQRFGPHEREVADYVENLEQQLRRLEEHQHEVAEYVRKLEAALPGDRHAEDGREFDADAMRHEIDVLTMRVHVLEKLNLELALRSTRNGMAP